MRNRSKAKTVITSSEEEGGEENSMPPFTNMNEGIDEKPKKRRSIRPRSKSRGRDNPMMPARRMPTRNKALIPSIQDQIFMLSTKFPNTVPASHPDTPDYAKYKYIEQGYRVDYSLYQCFLSLFTFHNESLNIWTHLLALIAWIALFALYAADYIQNITNQQASSSQSAVYVNEMGLYGMNSTDTDFILLTMYMFVGGCVYFFSVIYHTFGCLNEPCHDCLLKFDLMGICILLFGSYFPFFFYAFHCFWMLYTAFWSLILCKGASNSCFTSVLQLFYSVLRHFLK